MKSYFLIITLLFGITALAADDLKYYQPRREIIGYPPYALSESERDDNLDSSELLHNIRMTHHIPWDMDEEKADALAEQWARQGFNVILAEGTRYLFRDSEEEEVPSVIKSPPYEEIISLTKMMVEACHKHGLRYFQHLTCTMVADDLLREHPGWAAIDIATGEKITNSYGTTNTCINNENFMAAYFDRLERLIRETGIDGLMQDEIQFFGPTLCGCNWCKEGFKKDTGYEIPEQLAGWLYNFTGPGYREWLQWRRKRTNAISKRVNRLLKKYGRKNINITYLCNNSTSWAYYASGMTINDFKYYADSIGYECEPPDHRYQYYWPLIIWEMKYLRAVAELMDTGMWTLIYNRDLSEYTWNWMISMSQGSRLWWLSRDKNAEQSWQPILNWEIKHSQILEEVKSGANIGLLFSLDSRDRNPYGRNPGWIHGFASTCYALTDGHIPYRVLIDEEMELDRLKDKIDTLVLFNTMSLSEQAASAVREFVRHGGTLVTSGEVSLYNENGQKRDNFALADVLGFSHVTEHKGPAWLFIEEENPVTGDITGKFMEDDFFVEVSGIQESARVYGSIISPDGKTYPGLICNDFGAGKVIYFAGHPEKKYNFHYYNDPKIVPGKYWVDPRDETYGEILRRAVTCFNENIPLKVNNLPKGVVTEVYNHRSGGMQGIQVHLANFLGGYVEEGTIPLYDPISFPSVKNNLPEKELPISLEVKAPGVKDVFLLSPDFDATVRLDYTVSNDSVQVQLPTMHRYFILYFSQGSSEPFLKLNSTVLKAEIPEAKEMITEAIKPLAGDYDPAYTTVFANQEAFTGGQRIGLYKGEVGTYLYGQDGNLYEAQAALHLDQIPGNPLLEIGGMDDNASSKAQMEIRVNDAMIYSGSAEFPDQAWGVNQYPLKAEVLKKGKNVIHFKNLEKGVVGSIPWFGINFVRIRQAEEQ